MAVRRFDARIAPRARRQHGVFSGQQAAEAGATYKMLSDRVRRGVLVRVHRGVYRIAGAPVTWLSMVLAACLAAGDGAAAARRTAARIWGFGEFDEGPVEVVVGRERVVRRRGIVVHRARHLLPRDITRKGPVPVTSVARTLLDLAAELSFNELEELVEDALRRRLITVQVLRRRVAVAGGRGRAGVRALRHVLDLRGRSRPTESKLETELLQLLRDAGLPEPVRQHSVRLRDGPVRIDLAYPEVEVMLEADSETWHAVGRRDRQRDLKRQNDLVELGWQPLRITKTEMRGSPKRTVERVRNLLTSRGYPW